MSELAEAGHLLSCRGENKKTGQDEVNNSSVRQRNCIKLFYFDTVPLTCHMFSISIVSFSGRNPASILPICTTSGISAS